MLSDMQRRFCDYYLISSNASEAYIKAGYKVKDNIVAKANACRLLTRANIISYLDDLRVETRSNSIADIVEVKEFWTNLLRDKENKIDSKDRLKASEYLAKSAGAFIEKIESKNETTITIAGDISDWAK